MKKYKNYEAIKKYLDHHPKPILLNDWHELIIGELEISLPEVNEVMEEMVADRELVIHNDEVYYIDNIHYGCGSFRLVRESFGFVETEDESIYIGSDDFMNALDQDDVLVEIHHGKKVFGKILKTVERHRDFLLGTMKKIDGKLRFIPYDTRIVQKVDYDSYGIDVAENDRVIAKIMKVAQRIDVRFDSVLGQADEPGMDVLSVLYVYGLDVDFNDDVLDAIQDMPKTVSEKEMEGRMDHRDQAVITIDGEDAKDLDDAVYMETLNNGYRLYVHIADVSHYVPSGSLIDASALERSSSIYMVDRVVPMLPKELSNGICSLHPGVDRLVLTCQIDLSFQGEVIDYNIYESVIRSRQRLSYNQINQGEDLGEHQDMVELMLDCARRLNYNREQAGSIDFDSDETEFVVDNDGVVLDIFRKERGESETMIEAFMIKANEVVAQHCKYQSMPVLYRVHEEPQKERLQTLSHTLRILGYKMRGNLEDVHPKTLQKALDYFKDKPEYPVVSRLVLRTMSKARYSELPLGHFGLALEDYTHFTSPIRRYPDLLLHQRLKKYLIKGNMNGYIKDEAYVAKAAGHVSDKERAILEAERQVEKIKKAQYMEDKVGSSYIGYISGVANFGFFVELDNTVEGLVHIRSLKDDFYNYDAQAQKLVGERGNNEYKLGQKVSVNLVSVDMVESVVNFELKKVRKKRRAPRERRRKKS
ncbi:ribonuclease R [Erysipelothrix urinaevulpis]|uniref:ribonuclease R n=1 Tax=Erysipelothrix urinaevulpis TaxID=2683717 RepID=UPI001358D39D|nr:ribonuclease R [Erysipelothrix urinaevulpis]